MPQPRAYEIFSSNDLDRTSGFKADKPGKTETMQNVKLSKKNKPAPEPPGMKRFGAYKPKILATDSIEDLIDNDVANVGPENPSIMMVNSANLKKKAPSPPQTSYATPSHPSHPAPFVVGDKDVPMVLSTLGDDEDFLAMNGLTSNTNNNNEDNIITQSVDDLHIYNTVIENGDGGGGGGGYSSSLHNAPSLDALAYTDDSNLISKRSSSSTNNNATFGYTNHALEDNESPRLPSSPPPLPSSPPPQQTNVPLGDSFHDDLPDPPPEAAAPPARIYFTLEKDLKKEDSNPQADKDDYSEYSEPNPDYEEEEQTLDFFEDDDDPDTDGPTNEEKKLQRQRRNKPVLKEYVGEDFSKYLENDDDILNGDDGPETFIKPHKPPKPLKALKIPKTPKAPKMPKTPKQPKPIVLDEKHAMFKSPSATAPRKKSSKKGKAAPQFNSVRSFSYADSKFGTMGKVQGKNAGLAQEASNGGAFVDPGDSSYESFLRSRHGDAIPMPDYSNDTNVDAPPEEKQKDGMWKKLTWRLKSKRSSRDYS